MKRCPSSGEASMLELVNKAHCTSVLVKWVNRVKFEACDDTHIEKIVASVFLPTRDGEPLSTSVRDGACEGTWARHCVKGVWAYGLVRPHLKHTISLNDAVGNPHKAADYGYTSTILQTDRVKHHQSRCTWRAHPSPSRTAPEQTRLTRHSLQLIHIP